MLASLFVSLVVFISVNARAEKCHCDFTLSPKQTFLDGKAAGIKPGDVVCMTAGSWRNLKIKNLKGEEGKPVTLRNCGGQVLIGNTDFYYALVLENSQFFRVTGTGDPGVKYGIKITGTQRGSGISINSRSSDFEVDHVEVTRTGFAGIAAKTDPTCDEATWRDNFTMRNVLIHDNYIHNTGGEGFYIGNTKLHGMKRKCESGEKTVYAHFIKHVRIYSNIIDSTAWDGMQVSMANEDCAIYSNVVTNFGMAKKKSQDAGIVIGGGTTGDLYNNRIVKGTGAGIGLYGVGDNYIFNNLIADCGSDGIFIQDNKTVTPGLGFHILHNNIINAGRDGIRMYSDESSGNEFVNNVIINPGSYSQYERLNGLSTKDSFIFIIRDRPIDYTESNNYFEKDIQKAGFVDASVLDFRLKKTSPVIDGGKVLNGSGWKLDHNGLKRASGVLPDIGMHEYQF